MEESEELSVESKPTLEVLPRGEELISKRLPISMQQILDSILERKKEPSKDLRLYKVVQDVASASDVLLRFKWPEGPVPEVFSAQSLPQDEENVTDCAHLLSLVAEWETYSLPDTTALHVRYDLFKRRKWWIQAQVVYEILQVAIKNHRAQIIRKLMDDMAMVRFFSKAITEYLRKLNDASSQILALFKDLLLSYNDFKQPLNELNHMKKVLNHICRKFNVPGLSQHVERMDSLKIEIHDAGSAEYLEDITRTQALFSGDVEDFPLLKNLHNNLTKHFGFIPNLRRTRFRLWETYFSWRRESESSEEEAVKNLQDDPQVAGNFRDSIFQLASDFHMIAITLHLTVRSLLVRLKNLNEMAINIKKQYIMYKNYSIKLTFLESSLECCVKEWITFERELLTFKTSDLYKSTISQDLSVLSTLVPTDYMGWDLPLLASRADKILLRKVKKKKNDNQNKSTVNALVARAQKANGGAGKKGSRAGRSQGVLEPGNHRLSVSDEGTHHRMRRRQSRSTNQRAKGDWDASQSAIRKSASHSGKSSFDAFLEEFDKHLEDVGEKGASEEIKIPDLVSALQDDNLEASTWDRSSATVSECDAKMTFCENPIFTTSSHLIYQDRQINSLQNEYYEKLLSLIKSKDDFRKYKTEIANVRTRMTNLMEEYATVKKYIVSRDETHLVTNLAAISDSLKDTKFHHEIQSQKLNAEVKRSLRLIKKGKFEATEWLVNKMISSKEQNRLSDEEQTSKKSSSVSDQIKSSCRSEHRETSSSIANLTNEAEKEVSWDQSNHRSTAQVSLVNVEKSNKVDTILAMTWMLGGEKVLCSICRYHSKTIPPFCCLEEILPSRGVNPSPGQMTRPQRELSHSTWEAPSLGSEELINVLSGFRTFQRTPECEFPSHKEEPGEIESSSRQSSLKIETTLGSWSDSELEEALDSTALSVQDKMDSTLAKLMENESEIVRHLTHKYIIEKCNELFADKNNEKFDDEGDAESERSRMMKTAENERAEHHQDLMSLYQECSGREPIMGNQGARTKTINLYEARLRSETLSDIRNLKERIKEKQMSIVKLEDELERQKMRKYPTFDV